MADTAMVVFARKCAVLNTCGNAKEKIMTPMFKGFLWVALMVAMFAILAPKARAGTLDELKPLLEGKSVVYDGMCWFDQKGVLTFKNAERKTIKRCVVGMKLPDQTKHYLLIMGDRGPTELLVYDETTKTQEVLWTNRTAV